MLARPERFELPTTKFVAWYSIQLSYGRMERAIMRMLRGCVNGTHPTGMNGGSAGEHENLPGSPVRTDPAQTIRLR